MLPLAPLPSLKLLRSKILPQTVQHAAMPLQKSYPSASNFDASSPTPSIKDLLPKLLSEKPAYFPLSNIWRYPDVRKQVKEDLDLDFETASPVAQRIADDLQNRGVSPLPWFRRTQRSLVDGKKRTNRLQGEKCDLAGWEVNKLDG